VGALWVREGSAVIEIYH